MMILLAISIVWLDIGSVPIVRKHFADLYQALLEQNSKKFESHSNILEKANAKVNNALVMYNSSDPINLKGSKIFDFFKDPDGKIGHIGGGGVIGHNN